ncbi:hypothetical protein [Bosea psychrotolerans]|uniref:hypothetical protein n=1 Tax=Bosea psychrotolerans TaxID=1871628 RepID=UPI001AECF76D|nr:hypothetical protein [Bosea psychrotolerans]
MRGDHDQPAIAGAAPDAHDIADLVLLHILETMRTQHLEIGCGAPVLLERWGRNLGQGDDVGNGAVVIGCELFDRRLESGMAGDRGDFGGVVALHWHFPIMRSACYNASCAGGLGAAQGLVANIRSAFVTIGEPIMRARLSASRARRGAKKKAGIAAGLFQISQAKPLEQP